MWKETRLVYRVHSFHYSVLQKLEVAEFYRIVSAVVLQIFLPKALLESPSAGHGVSVHVGQLAVSGGGSVTGRPGQKGFIVRPKCGDLSITIGIVTVTSQAIIPNAIVVRKFHASFFYFTEVSSVR